MPADAATTATGSAGRRNAGVELLEHVASVAVLPSEMHKTAYYLPLVVRYLDDGAPELAAVVAPSLIGYPVISELGQWRPPYRPAAMRFLPYAISRTPRDRPADEVVMAGRHGAAAGPCPADVATADGDVIAGMKPALALLRQVRDESLRLVPVLDRLRLAGLLVPLDHDREPRLWTASAPRLAELPGDMLMALARDSFRAADVACSLLLSRRRLAPRYRRTDDEGVNPWLLPSYDIPGAAAVQLSPLLEAMDYRLDESETIG